MRSILREGRNWKVASAPDGTLVSSIQASLSCSHAFAELLAMRGGVNWGALIDPDLRSLHPPFSMRGMDAAVSRLERAIAGKEHIFIHGDFDADGLTGAAVLYRGLRPLLPQNCVKVDVGDRSRGHGLSHAFVFRAINEAFSLVITVDCGISNISEIQQLADASIDTIVTDHHVPQEELPRATAILDPHQAADAYANPDLAGVGVAFKLICGLYERLGHPMPMHLLDLVGLGTIADLVPLSRDGESENRAIVREAFAQMAKDNGSSLGYRVLCEKLSVNPKRISTTDIGYLIAPKLNAANRAGDPKVAFLLLITEDKDQAEYLAEILLDYNRDREIAQSDLIAQAEEQIRENRLSPSQDGLVFLVGEYWNEGILGLVASNLADRFHVPAVVLSKGDRVSRGSCRSVGSFDINACLAAHQQLLLRFGGHRMAAGFSVANEDLEALEEQLYRYVETRREDMESRAPETIDTTLDLQDLDLRMFTNVTSLGPFGPGNPEPNFLVADCGFADLTLVGSRKQHVKGRIVQHGHSIPFIAFRKAKHLDQFEQSEGLHVVGKVGFDDWRNDVQIQGLDLVEADG